MSDDSRRIYLSHPLSSPRDIRVLDIQPSDDFDSPVYCDVKVVSITDRKGVLLTDPYEDENDENGRVNKCKASYQTLSYAWGSSTATETIFCDGIPVKVTTNLDLALRRIRQQISPKGIFSQSIWMDAICINQEDLSEKGKQVAMMGDIFRKSGRLIIWLGEADGHEIADIENAMQNPKGPKSSDTLRALTQKPWFGRLWVVQEVLRSPPERRHALLGSFRCRFDRLIVACNSANVLEDCGSMLRAFLSHFQGKHLTPTRFMDKDRPSLMENIITFRYARASLAHDRLYALLSISDPRTVVPANYDTSLKSAYVGLVLKQIIHSGVGGNGGAQILSLLMCAIAYRVDKSDDSLPSWIPDWSVADFVACTNPQRLEALESDLKYLDALARHSLDSTFFPRLTDPNSFELDVAFIVTMKTFDMGRPCYHCRGVDSYLDTWLQENGKLPEIQQGRASVISIVHDIPRKGTQNLFNVVFLITHEKGEDGPLKGVLDSYRMLPGVLSHPNVEPGHWPLQRLRFR